MSRDALGKMLLACLLVFAVAIGQAMADDSKPAKKHSRKSEKKPAEQKASGDSDSSGAKSGSTEKEADDKKPDEKKSDEKKSDEKSSAEKKASGKKSADKKGADKKSTDKKTADSKADEKKSDATKEASKPATQKLKKGPFRVEVALDGVFEAQNQAELVIRPQEWNGLYVLKAVEHGAAVKQGDLVLAIDTEKIDRAIVELRSEMELNELALKQAAANLAAMEKVEPLEVQTNDRNRRMNEEDWNRYQEVDKPLMVKLNEYHLKSAKEFLEYAEEEYRQLEKMYKADDLKEETEKIVLRRAQAGVDRAKLSMEIAKANYDEARKLSLPRIDERTKDQTERARIDTEFTALTLPMLMSKHRLDVEKLQLSRDMGADRLKKLQADRDAMIVKAPIDGVVYYGRSVRGKWPVTNVDSLRRGAPIMPNDVFMTVVETRPLAIRTTVPESQFQRVRAGLQAVVQPEGIPWLKLTAVVSRVGIYPMGSNGFDCRLTVANDGLNSAIVPGINCELKMIAYKKTDALTIPPKAVFTDEFDLAKQYVYLQGKNGKPEKRVVTLGERNDKQIEVLQGLSQGDEILLEKPKDD